MNFVNNQMCNHIRYDFFIDCIVTYIFYAPRHMHMWKVIYFKLLKKKSLNTQNIKTHAEIIFQRCYNAINFSIVVCAFKSQRKRSKFGKYGARLVNSARRRSRGASKEANRDSFKGVVDFARRLHGVQSAQCTVGMGQVPISNPAPYSSTFFLLCYNLVRPKQKLLGNLMAKSWALLGEIFGLGNTFRTPRIVEISLKWWSKLSVLIFLGISLSWGT